MAMPNFFTSEYFVPEVDNWHLKEGAPDNIKEEFEKYMANGGDTVFTDYDPFKSMTSETEDTKKSFSIFKTDDDKRLVFGWASISMTVDGELLEDRQKDMIEPEDLEESVYDYVLNFRDTGEEHNPTMRKKGKLVESCIFTKDKQKAMGIPEGVLPVGWWIGFYIEDDDAWARVKDGTYKMFSIEGKANREPVEKATEEPETMVTGTIAKTFDELLEDVEKFNPYHDSKGRFSSANGATSFTYAPGKSKAHDLAIARAKEQHAALEATQKPNKPKKKKETAHEQISTYIKTQVDVDIDNYRDEQTKRFDKRNLINVDWKRIPKTDQQRIITATNQKYSPISLIDNGAWMKGITLNNLNKSLVYIVEEPLVKHIDYLVEVEKFNP